MNQQLLNINTVINPSNYIKSSINISNVKSQELLEINNLNSNSRLEHITYIVNNNTSSNKTRTSQIYQSDKNTIKQLKYKIVKYLGRGIHGNLYLAVDSQGRRVICKEILLDTNPSNNTIQTKQLEFELNILKYLSGNTVAREHINPCLDYKIYQDKVYTIFPVFKGYSLGHFHRYMLKLPKQDDYYNITFFLIKSLLHALAKIHDAGIAHQNIKLDSILVSTFIEPHKIKVKFTDFGLGCGCPKDSNVLIQSNDSRNIIPWNHYKFSELSRKIASCKENSNAPIKYMKEVLAQLKDSDYLKISQKYDVLCIGLIIIKFLLNFDKEINIMLDDLIIHIDNNKLQNLSKLIKSKYFESNYLLNDSKLLMNNNNRKLILEYIKFILKYMISPTIHRRPAQYIIDKIIIYEKYKNDVF